MTEEMIPNQIAIVGIGCKVPGADNLEQFWRVLEQGENHVIEIPSERWNIDAYFDPDSSSVGRTNVRHAGLLKDPLAFDNRLFNINDFEADQMDPQQRMVLECTHMAMEDGGFTRDKLAGSNTGVYVGAMNGDYRNTFTAKSAIVGNYSATGISNSIISARVSFTFDLRGPSMVVDTACSSALVAIHLGAQALISGDCDLAICGGVNFLMSPDVFVHLSKAHMVSPTGQCWTFSDRADGYTRGEGCGMVILKKLRDATRDGDRIWATIQTAMNQDGRSVTPINAPSAEQQMRLLDHVYSRESSDFLDSIDYIEAHGTGTPVGDPVEANTLGKFFQKKESFHHRYIGSVKTNLGHLESAAGAIGLIKVLLMMKYSKIVPNLFFEKPNPSIQFEAYKLSVPTEVIDWPAQKKMACVNAFGFGGTNCHALVRSCSDCHKEPNWWNENKNSRCIVCFSGKTEQSLKSSIDDFMSHIDVNSMDIHDVAYTSTVRRDHFQVRYAAVVESMSDLMSRLHDYIHKGVSGKIAVKNIRNVFVFSGMGTSWRGMCKELLVKSEVFKTAIQDIDQYLTEHVTWSLLDRLETEKDWEGPEFSPIAIFGCQVGLVRLWESLGVRPACVVGQSVGEVAAAHCAGILSLKDAVRIMYFRTSALASVVGGKMIVVMNMSVKQVRDIVESYDGQANISLEYSPVSCAVSGDAGAISRIRLNLINKSRQINSHVRIIELEVPVAYHSHHVDSCKSGLLKAFADISPQPPLLEMVASVKAELVSGQLGADYWVSNVREPVRFCESVQKTFVKGCTNVYIEIGPKPVLQAHFKDIFPQEHATLLPSMSPTTEWASFLQAAASLYELGGNINWRNLPHQGSLVTPVPRYSFNPRRRLDLCEAAHIVLNGLLYTRKSHPYVYPVDNTGKFLILASSFSFPSLFDHIVSGILIVPGAFYVEASFSLIKLSPEMNAPQFSLSVKFIQPCTLSKADTLILNLKVKKYQTTNTGARKLDNYKVKVVDGVKKFASIHILASSSTERPSRINIAHIRGKCPDVVDRETFYSSLKQFGFTYGPTMALMLYSQKNAREGLSKLKVPDAMLPEMGGTTIHPSILDNMIQTSILFISNNHDNTDQLPRSIGKITSYRPTQREMFVYTVLKNRDRSAAVYDLKLTTLDGEVIAEMQDLTIKSLNEKNNDIKNIYNSIWKPHLDVPNQIQSTSALTYYFLVDSSPYNVIPIPLHQNCQEFDIEKLNTEEIINRLDAGLNRLQKVDFLIVAITNALIFESEDASSVQMKCLNLCLFLKGLYAYANEKNLRTPIYLFTTRALPFDCTAPADTVVNPVMTALWGLNRSAIKEQIYADFTIIDLHLSESKYSLTFLTAVVEQINSDKVSKIYPEWLVTDTTLYVNQFIQMDSQIAVPNSRQISADSSQDCILLSKEPTALVEPFPVLHSPRVTGHQNRSTKMTVVSTALQSSLLFSMALSYHALEKHPSEQGSTYSIFALENKGFLEAETKCKKKEDKLKVACYPVLVGSKITIPRDAMIKPDLIPDYVLGDLTKLFVLWSLQCLVTDQSVAILASSSTARLGEALVYLLASVRGIKDVSVVEVEHLEKTEFLKGTIVSLVLLDETVVNTLTDRWRQPKSLVSIASLFEPTARSLLTLFLPSVQIYLLDTANIFQHQNILVVIRKLKKWMRGHFSVMVKVAKCLHEKVSTSGQFSEVATDLGQLLQVQTITPSVTTIQVRRENMFRRDALYLVVAGLSGLGWLFVKFLAENKAGCVAIMNRRQANETKLQEIANIVSRTNCIIKTYQADVSIIESLNKVFASLATDFSNLTLKGVFHGAAVLEDRLLLQTDRDSFSRVFSSKIKGTWNLHQLTKNLHLDYFCVHSSITSVLGNAGQANYGAGNAFMDGLIHLRRYTNLPGQTINWGPLDFGMASVYSEARKTLQGQGFFFPEEDEIFEGIGPILMLNWPQLSACRFDHALLAQALKRNYLIGLQYRIKSLLDTTAEARVENNLISDLRAAPSQTLDHRLIIYESYIVALVSHVLNIEDGSVQADSDLIILGLDSVVAMTLINQIQKELGCRLPAVIFITGQPTARTLARAIVEALPENQLTEENHRESNHTAKTIN